MWRLCCNFLNQIYLKCKIGSGNIPVFREDCYLSHKPTWMKRRGTKFTSPFKRSTLGEEGDCGSQEADSVQGDGRRNPHVASPGPAPGKPFAASDWRITTPCLSLVWRSWAQNTGLRMREESYWNHIAKRVSSCDNLDAFATRSFIPIS